MSQWTTVLEKIVRPCLKAELSGEIEITEITGQVSCRLGSGGEGEGRKEGRCRRASDRGAWTRSTGRGGSRA